MDDGAEFPRTFEQWEERAKRQMAEAAAAGIVIVPIILDPAEFLAFCEERGHTNRGSRERAMFAITRAAEKSLHATTHLNAGTTDEP
jgi:hypothetical protein